MQHNENLCLKNKIFAQKTKCSPKKQHYLYKNSHSMETFAQNSKVFWAKVFDYPIEFWAKINCPIEFWAKSNHCPKNFVWHHGFHRHLYIFKHFGK
jgi:hypothetical protein